jgi:dTDP-glucose pyrophosphorylase
MSLTGVIPAAGRGTRAYPYTQIIPKAMLDICGEPVLNYTISTMRDQLGIRDIVIVLGHHGEAIRRHFGDGARCGVRLRYVQNDRVELGLAHSVLLAREHVEGEHFLVMLSDELYSGSNHGDLLRADYSEAAATLAVRAHSANKDIRKNFGVELDGARVTRVIEKPAESANGLLGCGTYLFSRAIFDVIASRYARNMPQAGDLTGAIQDLIASGARIDAFTLTADYININFQEDIHYARSIVRRGRLNTAKISVVMPCASSLAVIGDMLRLATRQPRVAEVVLVARESSATLDGLAAAHGAKVVLAPGAAYGEMFRAGIAQSQGDIVVLTMDDESFDLGDISKLMGYMCEADLVLGTRTTSQLVQQGSNLNWAARAGNYALAKLIQLLWAGRGVRLTDVGCTFRALWRATYDQIAADVRATGPEFAPEMIVEALRHRLWVIEVPTHYCRTSDESRVRVEHRSIGVFFSMAATILAKRLR